MCASTSMKCPEEATPQRQKETGGGLGLEWRWLKGSEFGLLMGPRSVSLEIVKCFKIDWCDGCTTL